ncbi:MAG: hypothetical protein VYC34_05705 [Planctomycetota bacterium]|nr:hypothetical protein [Planctomycetota bacterium]
MRRVPVEIEVREDVEGVRLLLPAPRGNPVRESACRLLVALGFVEVIVTGGIVTAILLATGAPPAALAMVLPLVVLVGLMMSIMGHAYGRATTEILITRDAVISTARVGRLPLWRRSRRRDRIDELTLERERLQTVNLPGAREGHRDYLRLHAAEASGKRTIIATGHHRDVLGRAADEVASRLKVPVREIPDRM